MMKRTWLMMVLVACLAMGWTLWCGPRVVADVADGDTAADVEAGDVPAEAEPGDAAAEAESGEPSPAGANDVPYLGGPALTSGQWRQLTAVATDFDDQIDNAAWYPLLANATTWPEDLRAGAMTTDMEVLQAIAQQPTQFRGRLMLIEGQFVSARPVVRMQRRHEFPRTEEWAIKALDDPRSKDTLLVYLVDPPAAPALGQRVQIVARFYKVWRAEDIRTGDETHFLTFVGRTAHLADRPRQAANAADTGTGGGVSQWQILLVLLALLAVVVFFLRKAVGGSGLSLQPQPLGSRERRRLRDQEDEPDDEAALDDDGPPLPKDPVAALAELERRKALKRDAQASEAELSDSTATDDR